MAILGKKKKVNLADLFGDTKTRRRQGGKIQFNVIIEHQIKQEVQRLASAVLRLNPTRRVLVAGDASINYGQIMQAMVTLQLSGAPEIGLMSDPER